MTCFFSPSCLASTTPSTFSRLQCRLSCCAAELVVLAAQHCRTISTAAQEPIRSPQLSEVQLQSQPQPLVQQRQQQQADFLCGCLALVMWRRYLADRLGAAARLLEANPTGLRNTAAKRALNMDCMFVWERGSMTNSFFFWFLFLCHYFSCHSVITLCELSDWDVFRRAVGEVL